MSILTYLVKEDEHFCYVGVIGDEIIDKMDSQQIENVAKQYGFMVGINSRFAYSITNSFHNGNAVLKFIR